MAGVVHPALEARLAAAPAGTLLPVIVELAEQQDPAAAAARVPAAPRSVRGRAVVDALRAVAERTQPPVRALLAQAQARGEARTVRPFWVFNGLAAAADEGVIRRLAARDDVRVVRLDAAIPPPKPRLSAKFATTAEYAWNIEVIRAAEVWAIDPAYDGTGIVVGSFDTGVDGLHPDLAPRYRGNDAISWFDPYGEHASPADANGHGTHTVGTMVGGDLSGYQIGVAPGARWIAAKAWDDAGDGTESAFQLVFQWFLAPGGDPANAPHIVNSSWGLDPPLCFTEFRPGVQAFRAAGILPVFAAGNAGPDAGTVIAPGSYAESFTVGATDFFDEISFFSSQGPSNCDGGTKPNLSAPGEFILSTFPGGDYAYLDGTSMATPHVSGAAAVLLSIAPDLNVPELEAVLAAGAVDLGPAGQDNAFGYGRLDLMESARLAIESSGGSVVGINAVTAVAHEAGTVPGLLRVRRSSATDTELTVTYTVGGTAVAGSDYVPLSGSVTLPVGAASADIVVTPIDDAVGELDESVVVTLDTNPAYIVAPRRATVTITSDELPPDLVVTAFTAPASAGAGTPITLGDTTRNNGTSPAAATVTAYYLSADSALDATDVRIAARPVPALAAGAADSGSITFTLPADLAAGTYYLVAKADGDDTQLETQEENNTTLRSVAIGPDLVIASVSVPASAGAGQAIVVTDTTKNQAAGAAATSTTTFYLSADGVLDAADAAVGSRTVPALAGGASHTGSAVVTIPAGTVAGTYSLFVRADAANVVGETQEGNNTSYAMLRVGPDLTVTALTAPASGGAGSPITVGDTTRNAGSGAAPPSTTRFYLSLNSILEPTDVPLGARAVAALAAGASDSGSVTLTIPVDVAAGFYSLMAVADGDGAVPETVESNNTALRAIEIGADLVIASVSVPADAGAGQAITVTDATKNQGAGAAAATTTTFHLSSDWTLDAGDVAIGSRAVPALAAGGTHSAATVLTIPAGTTAGTYYLFARADAGNAVGELYETNNTRYGTVRIGPDLQVASLTAPAAGGAGATITVAETTRNAGAGAAAASATRFYLSTNGQLDAADVALGSRPVPALAAGASSAASTTLTIPPDVAGGSYWLLAVADGEGAVAETQENNNVMLRAIDVGPDLVVSTMTLPTDAGAGQSITLTDTARNAGAGSAGASATTFYLSADWILDAGDVAVGTRAVAPLAAGATETGSVAVTVPVGTATGMYYVIARADSGNAVAELNENNNTLYRTMRVGPDLTITAVSAPAAAGAGSVVTLGDTTRNAGGGAAPASATRFYLSVNGVLDAGDILLGARAVPALAGGASDTGTVALAIPEGTPAGGYSLIAVADGDGSVAETQENNNVLMRSIQLGADLTVTAITTPTELGAGQSITVSDTTRNAGAGSAGASTTTFYLSTDWLYDAADVAIGSRAVPALAAGASDTGSVMVTIPASTATGSYYLVARADAGNAVSELYETNNTQYRAVRVGPDLTVSALTSPASGGAGLAITVTDTTRNAGGGGAPASVTRHYLSVNGSVDASDVVLGARAVPTLAPGATDAGSVTLTIPEGTASGAYWLIAMADGEGAVPETYETNNVQVRAISIGPDLIVSALTAPTDAVAGTTIAVGDTARNQGAGGAAASTTTFYLSTDWTLDAADVPLGSRMVSALAPGATEAATTSLTLPAGLAAGSYYVIARCDSGNAVAELYETNNTMSRVIRISP